MIKTPPLLSHISARLAPISDSPALDASVLLAHIVGKPRTWVMAHPESTLTSEQQSKLDESLTRLESGESFPYVIGHWEFFGLDFDITPDVLIPRPETELLVEKAIVFMQNNPEKRNIADIGTGSGAIAVALAVNLSNANILATDISPKALDVAKRNAEKHNVQSKIEFIDCTLLPESKVKDPRSDLQPSTFDLICANLPYIPTDTLHILPIYTREPSLALDGGEDGLHLIRRLMDLAPRHLAPNALLLLEIEATRGAQAIDLAKEYFPEAGITLHQDLTRRDRLLEIQA